MQTFQPPARFESDGGRESASLGRGLGEVGGSLLKLTVIVAIVLLIQKSVILVSKQSTKLTQG